MNTRAEFFPEAFYHIFNQTNGKEDLFRSDENRRFFLSRFATFMLPFCYIHSYALMSNHFHFSLQIKSKAEIYSYISNLSNSTLSVRMQKFIALADIDDAVNETFHLLICDQIKRFMTSYTRSFNNMYNRSGSLFRQKFKRSHFDPEVKFRYLQYYIHHNARKHKIVNNFLDYKYHSYIEIVNDSSIIINRSKVLDWFDDLNDFISFHSSSQYEDLFKDIDLDEFL